MSFRFKRSEFRLPVVQLNHMEIALSFFATHVDGTAILTLTAREPLKTLELDARELEILEVALAAVGTPPPGGRLGEPSLPKRAGDWGEECAFSLDPARHKLVVPLPKPLAAGETLRLFTRCRCVPSDSLLEGIYRDVTLPGAPQQYISQCQQWGFQRILPVIDDCTAKCTFRTTLEGDVRYTHLISNGDIDRAANPDGRPAPKPGNPLRQVITFINNVPMAPYLFFVCAGKWDVLADEVRYPDGRRIALEYLVPPGKTEGARVPMEILKRSILWQHARLGYVYPFDTYRTICMEKSNYGGMENVGNTTIITEAALIDATTSDARLIYAHGVIVHEYEHNHCGSGVTMESPFDMWLNEAYTVDIERQFMASVFDPAFLRLREADAMRAPGNGPLAVEDTGKFGQIVREGFNDPDELVDGVTYVKAPEVLNMLRQLLGADVYEAGMRLYFTRYDGGNANTAQFLACFEEVSGQSLPDFSREWLFTTGYPQVTVRYAYDAAKRELVLNLRQTRSGAGGVFTLPFSFAAVDKTGQDIPGTDRTIRFESPGAEITLAGIGEPAFLSVNRDAGFYGTCTDLSATPEQLARQVRLDSNTFNRVEAMRRLTDFERRRLMDSPVASVSKAWLELYRHLIRDTSLSDGIRGYLLKIDEQPLDRALLPNVRENFALRQRLLRATARGCGEAEIFRALHALANKTATLDRAVLIERRFLRNAFLQLLAVSDTVGAPLELEEYLKDAVNITDRLNALTAVWQSKHAERRALLEREGEALRQTLGGYLGYLQVVGQSPREEVFAAVAEEERRPSFSLSHPGLSRALYVPLSLNNAQIWTPRGLEWLAETVIKLAPVSEYTTMRLIAPCQACRAFAPDLRDAVEGALSSMLTALKDARCPSVTGRIGAYLNG
ncbi:MAG: M1 family metallopeptidase [Kiritimatiellae bacterium]|nr:M1 family metallopeptidase [Kiritimatiellia bacterium]